MALKCAFCSRLCSRETMISQISEEEKTTIENGFPQIKTVIWIERQERAGFSGSTIDDLDRPPYRLHSGG